jgi:hypothetical protein
MVSFPGATSFGDMGYRRSARLGRGRGLWSELVVAGCCGRYLERDPARTTEGALANAIRDLWANRALLILAAVFGVSVAFAIARNSAELETVAAAAGGALVGLLAPHPETKEPVSQPTHPHRCGWPPPGTTPGNWGGLTFVKYGGRNLSARKPWAAGYAGGRHQTIYAPLDPVVYHGILRLWRRSWCLCRTIS